MLDTMLSTVHHSFTTAVTVTCIQGHLIALTGTRQFHPMGWRCDSNERNQVAFLRSGSHRDDCGVIDKPATGTCWVVGFGVMHSPVGVSPRLAEGMQSRRLWIDRDDAPMPRLREAEKLVNSHRVGLASPSTTHQEADKYSI